jgi:mitogen-activated protein kinase organizer 1
MWSDVRASFLSLITDPITSLWQSLDNNCVLVSTLDSTIRLFDKANGGLLQTFKGHVNTEYRIRSCLAASDKYVVSGSEDGRFMTWDLVTGAVVAESPAHGGRVVTCVSYHPMKRQALTSGVDGTATVWE